MRWRNLSSDDDDERRRVLDICNMFASAGLWFMFAVLPNWYRRRYATHIPSPITLHAMHANIDETFSLFGHRMLRNLSHVKWLINMWHSFDFYETLSRSEGRRCPMPKHRRYRSIVSIISREFQHAQQFPARSSIVYIRCGDTFHVSVCLQSIEIHIFARWPVEAATNNKTKTVSMETHWEGEWVNVFSGDHVSVNIRARVEWNSMPMEWKCDAGLLPRIQIALFLRSFNWIY